MSGANERQYPKEAIQVVAIVHSVLGSSVVGVYLFGSAVVGGLQPRSDVDVLAVVRKPLSGEVRQRLAARLMKVSGTGRDGSSARPIELTVINLSDVVPWRYPSNSEFVYGEWLREKLRLSPIARPDPDPDLAIVLRQVRENSIPMVGPGARDLLDSIPEEDVRRAIAESLPRLIEEIEGDERNVLLTLSRMWMTAVTGEIGPKDVAAGWALARLPQEHSALLGRAKCAYLGKATDGWNGRKSDLDALVGYMKESIEACLRVGAVEGAWQWDEDGRDDVARCWSQREAQCDVITWTKPNQLSNGQEEMKPRITVITLGVDDLGRSLRFYRDGLGFPTDGIIGTEFEHGAVVFIDLESGVRLALWPRRSIAHDTALSVGEKSATEFTLGHNVSSQAEVDAVMEQAANAGAVIVKPAQPTFWGGYAGYFQDPDGHLWEVVWNPQWGVAAE